MLIAGVDEAGYGPPLGPFTVGMAAFRAPDDGCLWDRLAPDVARRPGGGGVDGVVVADSKRLYGGGRGLAGLEAPVWAFSAAAGAPLPGSFDGVVDTLSGRPAPEGDVPWFAGAGSADSVPPPGDLPTDLDPARRDAACARVAAALEAAGVEAVTLAVRAVPAAHWNRSIARTANKAATAFEQVAAFLQHLWHEHGTEGVSVTVDQQGGRLFYDGVLAGLFPFTAIETVAAGRDGSCYRIASGDRAMTVRFLPRADDARMETALASIAAKYVREILMQRFNAWFAARQPGLRPTAGYWTDARRWLEDTAELRRRMGLDDERLVRQR